MLTTLRNNRSLTFYEPAQMNFRKIPSSCVGGFVSPALASVSMITASTTAGYHAQLGWIVNTLNSERDQLAQRVAQSLATDPTYQGLRSAGVRLAWKYEQADVHLGGRGSAKWNKAQRVEIKEYGRVRGSEGHHLENVSDHPGKQADPHNIKFYKDRAEHLQKGHGGNWDNESDAPQIDKNKILKHTNAKRVLVNEIRGIGIAVAIGLGIGMTIGFITTLARSGVSSDTIKLAATEGLKSGVEAGALSLVSYGIGRTIGEVLVSKATGILENIGFTITDNIVQMVSMGVVGTLTIAVFAVYQYSKLRLQGMATGDALLNVGKQVLFSLSLLVVSIVAQGILGGCAGIVVSASVGIVCIAYSVADSVHQRGFSEKIRVYIIDKCYPVFSV